MGKAELNVEQNPERKNFFEDYIRSAFDLSSGGMGIHLHAVSLLNQGKQLDYWAKASLGNYSSNFLVRPYIFVWTGRDSNDFGDGPSNLSPYSNEHLNLLRVTREIYGKIDENQIRVVLAGDEYISRERLTLDELHNSLLPVARSAGLVSLTGEFEFKRVPYSVGRLFGDLYKANIEMSQELENRMDLVGDNPIFANEIRQAAIYKLGCMLAVTDQFTYDANKQGTPTQANFRPPDPEGTWNNNWQKLFGEPMPTIEELYNQAYGVLKDNIDPNDPITAHFVNLETLPQFAR